MGKITHGRRQFAFLRDETVGQFSCAMVYLLDALLASEDDDGTPMYSDAEKLSMNEMRLAMFELIFPNGDYLKGTINPFNKKLVITQLKYTQNNGAILTAQTQKDKSGKEFLNHLSDVRMGIYLGILKPISLSKLTKLLVTTMPAMICGNSSLSAEE